MIVIYSPSRKPIDLHPNPFGYRCGLDKEGAEIGDYIKEKRRIPSVYSIKSNSFPKKNEGFVIPLTSTMIGYLTHPRVIVKSTSG